jgi:anti-sigma regulatory factor (Ser/Thr protein kinase)
MRWVLRAGGVAALVTDEAGRVRVWSAGAERLWSLPAARAEGRSVRELDLGGAARELGDAVERALRGAAGEGEEVAASDGHGHVVACSLHAHGPPADLRGGVVIFMRRARGDWAPGVSGQASPMAPNGHHSFELRVPAVPQSVGELRHALSAQLETLPVPTELVEDIGLAVSEAATNAVLHAYLGATQPGPLLLSARLMDDRVHVVVRDHGRGMTPRPDSPGLGLGLPLMTRLADAVQISTHPEGGTEVRMTFTVERSDERPRFAH